MYGEKISIKEKEKERKRIVGFVYNLFCIARYAPIAMMMASNWPSLATPNMYLCTHYLNKPKL